ncbi:pilus assembly protein N-terminal domain-containing protein [Hyphomicrobium sp. CS1GBMeth3]|uniref:pilus assembly protein N-terminal domain-containing protein n=1 Tax=Hyphomicrobium sp. CS1GBMeth3 TaxID=1892845 RepID=UPI0009FB5238|nr:pilus assembly protein N-terminal domain-containing protein [Hyphomicrobium sp. CS1GBMeth3]
MHYDFVYEIGPKWSEPNRQEWLTVRIAHVSACRETLCRPAIAVAGTVILLAALLVGPGRASAADLVVAYDQSQLLRLPRPVSSVIIGNPSIADVAIQGGNLLVVTGKTFGVTNIIALDEQRNIIQDQRIIVKRDEVRTVNLSKGGKRESYSCTPNCSPTLTIGDDSSYFDMISQHATKKTKFSEGATDSGDGQQ